MRRFLHFEVAQLVVFVMKKRRLSGLLALVLCFLISGGTQAQNLPNVVLIMADDIGLGDIGFYHQERTGQEPIIPTPHIDQLISEGMRFSDAHSPASLCAPTRFSMLTGNFPFRNADSPWGVWSPDRDAGIDPKYTTIARIAKEGGYNTAFLGKWGLGGVWDGKQETDQAYEVMDAGALTYGFDYALELPQGIQNEPYAFYENGKLLKIAPDSKMVQLSFEQTKYESNQRKKKREGRGDSNWDPTLAGSLLSSKATDFISTQTTEKPFLLYYCSQAVHVPHTPVDQLKGEEVAGTTPSKHGDMIKELDLQVGTIVQALKENGLYENTLLVFTSDNGGLTHQNVETHDSSNGLTGSKGSIYEGGHRVPFVAVWPNKIAPDSESAVTVVGQDMVATLQSILKMKTNRSQVFDSADLLPVFLNNSEKRIHKSLLHKSQSKGGPYYAYREANWKLVMSTKRREDFENLEVIGLYNFNQSIQEEEADNLALEPGNRSRIKRMLKRYKKVRLGNFPTVLN
ncbi:MAG: sulfatase-like hydrolase/transferase [Bacteroidota bacterium]